MTCPSCGAHNPAGAQWCSQCYESLGMATGEVDPGPVPTSAAPRRSRDTGVGHPDIRTTDDGVEWCCATCGSWTTIDRFTCEVCGLRMGQGPIDPAAPAIDAGEVTLRAALLPAGGHLALGRRGIGGAILAIVVLWLVGGVLLTVAALDGGQAPVSGLVLLLGAVGLWVAAFLDARVLATGRARVMLDARALVWVVAGVTGMLVVSLLVVSLQAAS